MVDKISDFLMQFFIIVAIVGFVWSFMPKSLYTVEKEAEEALEILRLHFAEDYITIWPCSGEQFNCELVYHILTEYKGETK